MGDINFAYAWKYIDPINALWVTVVININFAYGWKYIDPIINLKNFLPRKYNGRRVRDKWVTKRDTPAKPSSLSLEITQTFEIMHH